MSASWLYAVLAILGVGQWLSEYQAQRARLDGVPVLRQVWLAALCARARGDDTVEPACAARQASALMLALGAPVAWLLRADVRSGFALLLLGYALAALPLQLWACRAERAWERRSEAMRASQEGSATLPDRTRTHRPICAS
ncbi:MAG: hypothetical protein ACUVX9_07375 [Anaerolineae bacterium]